MGEFKGVKIGEGFGTLTVAEAAGRKPSQERLFRAVCVCGRARTVGEDALRAGLVFSCGFEPCLSAGRELLETPGA